MRAPLVSNRCNQVRPRLGVTLIDMVVAILLLSIVSSVTVPRMTESLERHRLNATAHLLANSLIYLKNQAIIGGRDVTAVFSRTPPSMQCDQVPMPNRPGETFAIDLQDEGDITITNLKGISGNQIRFDRFGDIHDSKGKIATCTIILASSKAEATITVEQNEIRIETVRK